MALIFISYARPDEPTKVRLLTQFRASGLEPLRVWDDSQIQIGDRWTHRIESAIQEADLAVLLISADYLTSDFVRAVEVPLLIARGIELYPLLIGHCPWKRVPWLESLQMRTDHGQPLGVGRDLDRVLSEVVEELADRFPSTPANTKHHRGTGVIKHMASAPVKVATEGQTGPGFQTTGRVFLIFGRDLKLRSSMMEFLISLGLEPVDWGMAVESTGNPTPTIAEIFLSAFKSAQAIVVLLSGDDEARMSPRLSSKKDPDYERSLTPQPRANVLFEAGLANGLSPERTVIIQIGQLRTFSDLSGMYIVRLDNSIQARQAVAHRLRRAGCSVNSDGQDWLTAGDFGD